jgi:hypothetical protein
MFDPAFDRTLSYRLASAYDCWGKRRSLRRGTQNGIWFLDATEIDEPASDQPPVDPGGSRQAYVAIGLSWRAVPQQKEVGLHGSPVSGCSAGRPIRRNARIPDSRRDAEPDL